MIELLHIVYGKCTNPQWLRTHKIMVLLQNIYQQTKILTRIYTHYIISPSFTTTNADLYSATLLGLYIYIL